MRKAIGLLLCVVLVISSVGVGVYAAEPPPYSGLPADGVIVILPQDADPGFSREDATKVDANNWQPSVNAQSYGGGGIGHWASYNTTLAASYTPTIPTGGGEYEIYAFVPHVNTGNMSATVTNADGTDAAKQYYTSASANAPKWCLIGTYMLEEGTGASVRLNATSVHSSGTFGRMDAVAFVRIGDFGEPTIEIIVEVDGPGYAKDAGITATSSNGTSYNGGGMGVTGHYITQDPLLGVTYTPALPEDGEYEIYVWRLLDTSNTSNMNAEIAHAGGITAMSYAPPGAGNQGWHPIGTYMLKADDEPSVRLSGVGITGDQYARMDAVKFKKIGEFQIPSVEIIIKPEDSEYIKDEGAWSNSKNAASYDVIVGHYYTEDTSLGVTYAPAIQEDGEYAIYVWRLISAANTANMNATITHGRGISSIPYAPPDTGGHGWYLLGNYMLKEGGSSTVRLNGLDTVPGAVFARMDTIKFTKVGDFKEATVPHIDENGVIFTDQNDDPFTTLVGVTEINVAAKVIDLENDISSITTILAIYSSDGGQLLKLDINPANAVVNEEADISNTLNVEGMNLNDEDYVVKLLIWYNLTNVRPVISVTPYQP